MTMLGLILLIVGALIALVGWIGFMCSAWEVGILWFLGCLLVPFVNIVFLILNWHDSKKPFFIHFLGALLFWFGFELYDPAY